MYIEIDLPSKFNELTELMGDKVRLQWSVKMNENEAVQLQLALMLMHGQDRLLFCFGQMMPAAS